MDQISLLEQIVPSGKIYVEMKQLETLSSEAVTEQQCVQGYIP